LGLVINGQSKEAFKEAFEFGDELFEVRYNALDGVGANVGGGERFTRVPRADLTGSGEWADHFPPRTHGPNAQGCNACHNEPFDDGAGAIDANVSLDPLRTADLGSFVQRNTPHVFAVGAVQRLAEEMTEELQSIREQAESTACTSGADATLQLKSKGVEFGTITASPISNQPCAVGFDLSNVIGIDPDLVVRPFQWKGSIAFIREFNRNAAHNELGMQAVEIVGEGVDGDFDDVSDEMTIGDQTALAVYLAAQPRPTTKLELASLGLMELSSEEIKAINRGQQVFDQTGCATCHSPLLKIHNPIFSEPSQHPQFRDTVFPAGQDPVAMDVDPNFPVTFDLTRDQPDNQITDRARQGGVYRLGSLETDREGRAIVRLYGDLKRHDMGPGLAEAIDDTGTGESVFLTENLWGVGSTAPYLHDGRASTLTKAVLEHSGEAEVSRQAFVGLSTQEQSNLIAFLENLVLFKLPEEP
jgi:cytochrome c peroxidase